MKRVVIGLLVLLSALAALASPAAAYQNWSYGYLGHDAIYNYDYETQSTLNYPARFWPAQGYSTSSSYYRLGTSLSNEFKSAARAADTTWDGPDSMFHYYELAMGSDPYDRTLGMTDLGSGGTVGQTWPTHPWNSGATRQEVTTWYIRFEANLFKYGVQWVVGASPNSVDIQDVVTHEMGHTLLLIDVDYSNARETMDWETITNSTARRTLEGGDTAGVQNLY